MIRRPDGTAIVLALVLLLACAAGLGHGQPAGADGCGLNTASQLHETIALGDVPAALDAWLPTRPCLVPGRVGMVEGGLIRPTSAIVTLPPFRAPPVVRLPSE